MALSELLFPLRRGQIGVLELDVTVSETHTYQAQVSEHPVEDTDGVDSNTITDHIRVQPFNIVIDGVITNTPAELLPLVQTLTANGNPADLAYEVLLQDLLARKLVTVVTTLRTYENMAFTSLRVSRTARQGDGLFFQAALKQVRKVQTKFTAFKPVTKAAGGTVNKGAVQPEGATTATTNKSAVKALF